MRNEKNCQRTVRSMRIPTPMALSSTAIQTPFNSLENFLSALSHFQVLMWRSVRLLCFCGPVLIASPLLLLHQIHSEAYEYYWKILRFCISNSGSCAVKFAQWVSTRYDLFPSEVCDHLQELQTNSQNIPDYDQIQRALAQTFQSLDPDDELYIEMIDGCTKSPASSLYPNTYFANINDLILPNSKLTTHKLHVIGSGCVASVLKGRIVHKNGKTPKKSPQRKLLKYLKLTQSKGEVTEDIAIKIIHPNTINAIQHDIEVLQYVSYVLEYLFPSVKSISFRDSVEEFHRLMTMQLNMYDEAKSLETFRKNFLVAENEEGVPASSWYGTSECPHHITFPRPLREYTTANILTETYQGGIPMSQMLQVADNKMSCRMAQIGLHSLLKMVFLDNFIHAGKFISLFPLRLISCLCCISSDSIRFASRKYNFSRV